MTFVMGSFAQAGPFCLPWECGRLLRIFPLHSLLNYCIMRTTIRFSFLILASLLLLASSCKSTKVASTAAFSPLGTWAYEMLGTPEGDFRGDILLEKGKEGVTGILKSSMGEIPLDNIEIDGKSMKATFDAQGYQAEMTGSFEDEGYKGNVSIAGYTFPVTMTKKK